MIRIAPSPGLIVPGPDGRPLPADGIFVPEAMVTRFWRRRQTDGDVTITTAVEADTETATPKKKG
jgi:hypothetical protein